MSLPSRDNGTVRIPSIRSASHLSDSGILLQLLQRILQDRIAGPTFTILLFWQACTGSSPQIPDSVCCPFVHTVCVAASFRHCLHLFIRYAANSTSQQSILASGRDVDANTMLQCSLQRSGLASHKSHRAFGDSVGLALSHWSSLWHNLTSFFEPDRYPLPGSLSHLSAALLCSSWSLDFAALFAIQGNSVPFLGTSIAHVIVCLVSRMTSTRVTCSSDSFSPRNHNPSIHEGTPSKSS